MVDWLHDDATVSLDAGSRNSGTEMFYQLVDLSFEKFIRGRWNQPIPEELELSEGEYYALIKGLQMAREQGYSEVWVATNSPPILDQLMYGERPSVELKPFYEKAVRLIEQFDGVEVSGYAVDMRKSE